MFWVPIKILQLISIKPTAMGHSVIEENDGDEYVGKGRSVSVLTRQGEKLAPSHT